MPRISILPPSARVPDQGPELDRPTGDLMNGVISSFVLVSRLLRADFLVSDAKLFDFLKRYDPLP